MKKRNVKQEKPNFMAAFEMPVVYSMGRSTRLLDISVQILGVVSVETSREMGQYL